MNLDELKTMKPFKWFLIVIWVITFVIICYSENEIQSVSKGEPSITDTLSTSVKK